MTIRSNWIAPCLAGLAGMTSGMSNVAVATGVYVPLPSAGIIAPADISGVARFGDRLLIGADEGGGPNENRNTLQVLGHDTDGGLVLEQDILLFEGDETDGRELDIEGVAVDDGTVYVAGSHSAKRSAPKPDKKHKKNLKKFKAAKIKPEINRGRIYRLGLNADVQLGSMDFIRLRELIAKDPVLGLYQALPSKENGIDIEGIAARDGLIHLGFRGPVFRGGYAPVMALDFDDPEATAALRFIPLDGRGIRDLAAVSDGFLVIAGPVGDGPASYQLYHWDGRDMVPGTDRKEPLGHLRLLTEIQPPENGKAEGVAVMDETPCGYRLMLAFDGVEDPGRVLKSVFVPKQTAD